MNVLGVLRAVLMCVSLHALAAESTSVPPGRFFALTNLWEIHLTLPAGNWESLAPRERERAGFGRGGPRPPGPGEFDRKYPWSTATFECAGLELTNIAIRFKGNSSFNLSRNGLKRPLKFDFDRGAKGRTFPGHEELLLNNNFNDGAQFREALGLRRLPSRRAGCAAHGVCPGVPDNSR